MTIEVTSNVFDSKIIESEAGPALSMGLSFKVLIPELLHALTSMTEKQKQWAQHQQVKPKIEAMPPATMHPPMQPGLVPPPAPHAVNPPIPSATVPAASTGPPAPTHPEDSAKDAPSPTNMGKEPHPEPTSSSTGPTVTWDTDLAELQPSREEYKARWSSSVNGWELLDEEALRVVKINRLERRPLLKKAPTPETSPHTAQKAEEAFAASQAQSQTGPSESLEVRKSEESRKLDGFPPLVASPPSMPPPPAPGGQGTANNPNEPHDKAGARPDVPPMPSGPPPAPPASSQDTYSTNPNRSPSAKSDGGKESTDKKECKQQ